MLATRLRKLCALAEYPAGVMPKKHNLPGVRLTLFPPLQGFLFVSLKMPPIILSSYVFFNYNINKEQHQTRFDAETEVLRLVMVILLLLLPRRLWQYLNFRVCCSQTIPG